MRWAGVMTLVLMPWAAIAATEDEQLVAQAVGALAADDLAAAVTALRKALAIRSDDVGYHLLLIETLNDSDRGVEAVEAAEAALQRWPDDPQLGRSYGSVLLDLERWEAAAERLRKFTAAHPDDGWALMDLGYALSRGGKSGEALVPLRAATGLVPAADRAVPFYHLGWALHQLGRWAEAAEALAAALEADPKQVDGLELMATIQAENSRWAEVLTFAERAREAGSKSPKLQLLAAQARLGLDPKPENTFTLAEAQVAVGDFADAEQTWRAAITEKEPPLPPAVLLEWASKLNGLGLYELGEEAARTALQAGETPEGHQLLGDARRGQHLLDEAEEAYRKAGTAGEAGLAAIATLREQWAKRPDSETAAARRAKVTADPARAVPHNELAVALQDDRRHDEAEAEMRRAIDLYGDHHAVMRHNLADALRSQRRYAAAGMILEATLADDEQAGYDGQQGNLHYKLGLIHYALEQYEAAERQLAAALEWQPDKPDYLLNLGEAIHKQGHVGRAEEVLRRTVALPAASSRAWNELANVIYGQRRFEESLEFYRQAIAKSPGAAVYHANLAGALLQLNRREEALAAARQAKALGIQTHWALKQLGF